MKIIEFPPAGLPISLQYQRDDMLLELDKATHSWKLVEIDMEDDIFDSFKETVDKVLLEKSIPYGDELVGRIKSEYLISPENIEPKVIEYFNNTVVSYCKKMSEHCYGTDNIQWSDIEPVIMRMWVNEMTKYEYNPLHSHNGNLTTVIFLEIPQNLAESNIGDVNKKTKKYDKPRDGAITFVPTEMKKYSHIRPLSIDPKPKKFYMLPANMLHTVHPFDCEGVRISVSFNIQFEIK